MHSNYYLVMSGLGQVIKDEELQTKGLILLVDARGVGFGLLRRFARESIRTLVLATFCSKVLSPLSDSKVVVHTILVVLLRLVFPT